VVDKLSKEEFELYYATNSKLTVEELRNLGISIHSCNCDEKLCKGWKAVTQWEIDNG
jgi:hypothetical protein